MTYKTNISNYLKTQMAAHKNIEAQDLIKMCYQAAFGVEHLITEKETVKKYLFEEFSLVEASDEPLYEEISDKYSRVNLGAWKKYSFSLNDLLEIFLNSVEIENNKNKFMNFLDDTYNYLLVVDMKFAKDFDDYRRSYLLNGIRPLHHSEIYRKFEKPSYRLVNTQILKKFLKSR